MDDKNSPDKPSGTLARSAGSGLTKDIYAPNPQGKGQVGFLQDWHYSSPRTVVAKPSGQLMADYFTSLLVLSADFKFKPAFGTSYYLYRDEPRWMLSLISPDEWNTPDKHTGFVGTCQLHEDSTWSIEPGENLLKRGPVAEAVGSYYEGFVEKLKTHAALEDELPIYEGHLPYYQRLFAAALSRSLKASMAQGGQLSRESLQWLEALPGDAGRFLLASTHRQ